jgi:hypothetical protein
MKSNAKWRFPVHATWVACLCVAALLLGSSGCNQSASGPGRIAGTITVDGRASAGVKVMIYALNRAVNDRDGTLLVQGGVVQEVATTGSGVYDCSIAAGKYMVIPAGYQGVSRLVEVKPGETTRADFQLPR